jgi:hypothetical protein
VAVSVNYLPVALGGDPIEMIVLALLHLVFIGRIRVARTAAAKQRAVDLLRFQELLRASEPSRPTTAEQA